MDFLLADRVQETSGTTGTGTLSLGGAALQARSFVSGVGTGNRTCYCILSGNGIDWETGIGLVTTGSPPTLTRDTILASSNSGAAISLSGTSTVFGASPAASIIQPQPNILINGGMEIDQANEAVSVALSSGVAKYVEDGWQATFSSATAVVSTQRVTDAPSGFANSLKLTVATGAAVAAGDYLNISQPIEANEITESAFGTSAAARLCLAFWVKSSIGSYTASAHLRNFAATRSFPFTFSIASANTWEKKVIVIPGDTAGSWVLSGNGGGAALLIAAACGSTFQGTANAWAAGNFFGTSANTNTILSTNGATFQITGVKLEISNVPTPLVREPFERMLARCRRYLRKTFPQGTKPAQNAGIAGAITGRVASATAGSFSQYWAFSPPMRATPTITTYNPSAANANWRSVTGASDVVVQVDVSSAIGDAGVEIGTQTTALTVAHDLAIHALADSRL